MSCKVSHKPFPFSPKFVVYTFMKPQTIACYGFLFFTLRVWFIVWKFLLVWEWLYFLGICSKLTNLGKCGNSFCKIQSTVLELLLENPPSDNVWYLNCWYHPQVFIIKASPVGWLMVHVVW